MYIKEIFITPAAQELINTSALAQDAYYEIKTSIQNMISRINNSEKNCNGVVPIKEGCYQMLEENFHWFREKPLATLAQKGGPIDVYKEFYDNDLIFCVGLEFETGNISSAHRSMNKLLLGIHNSELDLAVLLMPMHSLSYYLTDRVSNYEELKPYFPLVGNSPFIILGFDAEEYTNSVPCLPKGSDGMSKRAIHKWKNR